jgi:hypothetical protein
VLRENGLEVRIDVLSRENRVVPLHNVRNQALVPRGVVTHDHGHLVDMPVSGKLSLYLSQLNTKATDFYLIVTPADELERAIRTPPT